MIETLDVRVFGSCVSRDIARICGARLRAVQYIARQSWISAANPPVSAPSVASQLQSPFQQRNLDGDFASSALGSLRASSRSSVTVLDLIDERFGVWQLGHGYVTDTQELRESGWNTIIASDAEYIPFGSDTHFDAWSSAAKRILSEISRDKDAGKPIVIRGDFVHSDVEATPLPRYGNRSSEEWNELFARYYQLLEGWGLEIVEPPREFLRTHKGHAWGPAPFHYVDGFYEYAADSIYWAAAQ